MRGTHIRPDGSARIECHHSSADRCFVAGSFSDWAQLPLSPAGDGWWSLDLPPQPDGEIQYKFVADGSWFHDPVNYLRTADGQNSRLHAGMAGGAVQRRSIDSQALGRKKWYLVYLPPEYALQPDRSFPALILLGGLFEDETGFAEKGRLIDAIEALRRAGEIGPFMVFMPDKDNAIFAREQWGAYFSYLSQDLSRHIDEAYRAPMPRAIEGLSLGAPWALWLALEAPQTYCSVSLLSCYLESDLQEQLYRSSETLRGLGARFRLACGTAEPWVVHHNTTVERKLQSLGIETELRVDEGPHDWELWRNQLRDSLLFHWHSFARKLS